MFAPIVKLERDEGVQQVEAEVDQVRIRLVGILEAIFLFVMRLPEVHFPLI